MKRRPNKPLMVALGLASTASAVLAWRDLSHRSDSEVRGKKNLWRIFIGMNPGNSVFYWLLGRR